MNVNKLRGKIAEKGETQGTLSEKMGISSNSLSRKINGKREFTLSEVEKICRILNIDDPREIFLPLTSHVCNEKSEKGA